MRRYSAILAALLIATPCVAQSTRGGGGLPPRDEWQRVADIIASLGEVRGKRIADVAAGNGYLTRHLSAAVGPTGRVIAVDIGEIELNALRALARDSLANLEVVAGTPTDPRLPAGIDGVAILNSYHELSDYKAMLAGIRSALRPGGVLVLVDNAALAGWYTKRDEQASHHAIDPAYVETELKEAGFTIVKRQDDFIVQPYAQWLIVARR